MRVGKMAAHDSPHPDARALAVPPRFANRHWPDAPMWTRCGFGTPRTCVLSAPEMPKPADEFARVALPLMDQVYAVALYLARNRDEADDLLQETYLRAYRFWHQFVEGTNCKAWVLTSSTTSTVAATASVSANRTWSSMSASSSPIRYPLWGRRAAIPSMPS